MWEVPHHKQYHHFQKTHSWFARKAKKTFRDIQPFKRFQKSNCSDLQLSVLRVPGENAIPSYWSPREVWLTLLCFPNIVIPLQRNEATISKSVTISKALACRHLAQVRATLQTQGEEKCENTSRYFYFLNIRFNCKVTSFLYLRLLNCVLSFELCWCYVYAI